jgi:flagellar biosynthesis/type III secretory pathway protein FliH
MAGIIKAASTESLATSEPARAFQFDDMGRSYLGHVQTEAAKIIAEARQEAAKIKAKATEEGKQAAIAAVEASLRARLEQQLKSGLAALAQASRKIEKSRHAWQQHWETHAVRLAAAMAERLCRRELTRDPDITLTWVHEALELAAGNAQISLRLNPADHAALAPQVQRIAQQIAGLAPVQIVVDDAITPGGCRVETQFGSLDQQLEAQLARLTEELLA